jgi:hypothetical protein
MEQSARVDVAVGAIRRSLERQKPELGDRPVIRRKVTTLMRAAGYQVLTLQLRQSLARSLELAGLHVFPNVCDPTVRRSAFLRIGLHPFPPEAFLFEKESHLERFVEASLGIGSLSRLSLYQHHDGRSGRQFLISERRVDLLCKEALGRDTWGLVAMEFKRSAAPKGTLTQLGEYLMLLAREFPGRPVRGMVVSSCDRSVDRHVLGQALAHSIEWYRYKVSIDPVGSVDGLRVAN